MTMQLFWFDMQMYVALTRVEIGPWALEMERVRNKEKKELMDNPQEKR